MVTARLKPDRRLVRTEFRILCGKTDARGCHSCSGELGHLVMSARALLSNGYFILRPLVNAAMVRDARCGAYRLGRQRRPFLSGQDGSRAIGGGMARSVSAHLRRDEEGQPLKWLEALYESDSGNHERMVICCPRCQTPNEVTARDFRHFVERGGPFGRSA
jgi:hypothetical protein